MKVYLVRHGEAVSSQFDPQRPLSDKGLADIRKVASFIKPLEISVEHIRHSGKLRAAQTAEILAESVSVEKDCSAHKNLSPNDDVTGIADEIEATETASVASFDAGSIACLNRRNPGQWQIEWIVTPKLLS